ncbi:MAG TPA: caspase family protein [Kofleriaceae bacterium]|nr:caspase family protein [Kofleriaceae bacterium]
MRSALLICALVMAGRDAAAAPPVARFAIVIGNNHSSSRDARDLRYADDDAVAMHQLLADAGVKSALFVSLDAESRGLYPGLVPDGRPRWSALRARIDRMEREIRAAAAAGQGTALLVFFSGHGDVEHGEGFVELEDAHLTRGLLRRSILDRTAADEVHLVVDSCRSYYLAFEKGPGGTRRPGPAPLVGTRHARTGYILSTSSDRESHEWEAFQGGVFSHEVRSGLRGAADADRDGSVTYAELGAFLTVANRGIANSRFRPDFVVRPPGDLSDELLRWSGRAETLLLDVPDQGHMVLEGPGGERVLDVNAAAGQELVLHLPARRPLFLRRASGDREFAITGQARLSELAGGPLRVASKGAINLAFRRLFSAPFGAADVAGFRAAAAARALPGPAIEAAMDDVQIDRAGGHPTARRVAGATAIASGAAGLVLAGWAIERSIAARGADQVGRPDINDTVGDLRLAAGVAIGVSAGAGLVFWLLGRDRAAAPPRLTVAPSDGGYGLAIGGAW